MKKGYFIKTKEELEQIIQDGDFRKLQIYTHDGLLTFEDIYIDRYGTIIRPAHTVANKINVVARVTPFDCHSCTQNAGYTLITIYGHSYTLHRLVASTWCYKRDDCDEIDHRDMNKKNCSASNLECSS